MNDSLVPSDELKLRVSETLFSHIDGIAIGSTVLSLKNQEVFKTLLALEDPVDIGLLARKAGFREGFFQVALRLLAHQGFVKLSARADLGRSEVSLTREGREWSNFLNYYEQIPKISEMAELLIEESNGNSSLEAVDFALPSYPAGFNHSPLARRVHDHVFGEISAVIMTEMYLRLERQKTLPMRDNFIRHEDISASRAVSGFTADVMGHSGWATQNPDGICLTESGRLALEWTPQYFYPVSYLATLRNVSNLLDASQTMLPRPHSTCMETHVDRRLDIRFSGLVYEKTCRRQFLDIVLPLFDRNPIEEQPASIVDTGSGDGTLLVDLFQAIRHKTIRGRFLESFPLQIVGAEFNEVARDSTQKAFTQAGLANALTIFGDIGNPETLEHGLAQRGIDPFNALHVNKSVIHNRSYKNPRDRARLIAWQPTSRAPFVAADGGLIESREAECNLVEFFEDWRRLTGKHGMVVIEAHTVDPEVVCRKVGRNIMTCVDATHGYSTQYLIEYDAFLRAARTAGYESRDQRILSEAGAGRPTLAVNHFIQKTA